MNKKLINLTFSLSITVLLASFLGCSHDDKTKEKKRTAAHQTNLKLPPGFAATIIADSLGALRHLVVNEQGDIYVKLNALKDGKGIYFLSDTDHDGLIDKKTGFGDYPGTGIKIKENLLYSASNTGVYRYRLDKKGEVISPDKPEVIVQGLVDRHRDNSKSIAIDDQNNLFVTVGSYSDNCRIAGSGKGMPGCPILDSAAGIWKFKADKPGQTYRDGVHYARGIKNAVGIDWNSNTGALYCMQHGRGQFDDQFPQYYTPEQSADLPAETMYELHQGSDAGWPFVYYDPVQKKNILAPEYGGNGKKGGDKKFQDPLVAFPAHLGPNDLLFYTGNMFPERYQNGAFIVFHGQSHQLHKGYFVAFVRFRNGRPSGNWEIFADNFAGEDLQKPVKAFEYRPIGLAQGPDGSLYVSDDLKGSIFKITYNKKNNRH